MQKYTWRTISEIEIFSLQLERAKELKILTVLSTRNVWNMKMQ